MRIHGLQELQFNNTGVVINYVAGPNNGPALVLLPAQMGTWESYQKVLPKLMEHFQVFAVDLPGHGKSSWTTGNYSWSKTGVHLKAFLRQVVQRAAIVSGNSSGGIFALWVAANEPEYVRGIILEDAPLFSAEIPRFRDTDKFVYQGLQHLVEALGDVHHRDLADYFKDTKVPKKNGKIRQIPPSFVKFLSFVIKRYDKGAHSPIDIPWFPATLRTLIRSLSTFDPDFARAFVDGRFYEDFRHAEALQAVSCPVLILHGDWFRHPVYGLVGAMDDHDAIRARELATHATYLKIEANHVIHFFKPRDFEKAVIEFAQTI
jgi:pimeloyl-ACP methyl ester carboxylesterase